MNKFTITNVFIVLLILLLPKPTFAYYAPDEVPNNRAGVHILEPGEIEDAAKLVNSSGGEWGYVTVPIRADDRDYKKWFTFFQKAREKKVIPIIRLTSWAPGGYWHIPTDDEILHSANFLSQMPWPTQNRYIIVFNEPNHNGEWGGSINPEEYAEKLALAINIFKSKDPNYFLLPAALDRAAPNGSTTIKADAYWQRVFNHRPELVQMIDGWNSHAYPNPAFSGKPTDTHSYSIISYQYEQQMLAKLGRTDLPIFITEVGWSRENLSEDQIVEFWNTAWNTIWQDPNLVSINVWLLRAHDGPFEPFTLLGKDQQPTSIYRTIEAFPKIAGQPRLAPESLPVQVKSFSSIRTATPTPQPTNRRTFSLSRLWTQLKNIVTRNQPAVPTLTINEHTLNIEIADDNASRTLGLGHRSSMPTDHGMLFTYDRPNYYGFWMKHTLFPLDMIWIHNGKVVDISHDVPVEPDPANPKNIYQPQTPASWILETNAGWAKTNNIRIGDSVTLSQ